MIRWQGWALAAVVVALLIRFGELASYFFAAVALSFVGRPVVGWLASRRLGRWRLGMTASAAITLGSMVALTTLVLMLFAPLVQEQLDHLRTLNPRELKGHWNEALASVDAWTAGIDLSGVGMPNSVFLAEQALGILQPTNAGALFSGVLSSVGNLFVAVFSVLFMSFFLMREPDLFKKLVLSFTPASRKEAMTRIMESSGALLTRYFGGLVIQVGLIAVLVSVGLSLIGVPHGVLLGLLAGLLNLIPYLGPVVGAGIGALVMISSGVPWGMVAASMAVYLAAQVVDNLFTQPVVFARSVHAHPLEIFAVISIAGSLAGATGMVLAIPAYTLFRVIVKEFFQEFEWVQAMTQRLDGKGNGRKSDAP